MTDHTHNTLGAAIKALTDVVAPSVSAEDPLAQEQLRLVVAYLGFVRDRLDHLHGRERFELRHHLDLAAAVAAPAGEIDQALAADLVTATTHGTSLLADPTATTAALRDATAALAGVVRELVRTGAAGGGGEAVVVLERAVVRASAVRIEAERAWYRPLGFDPKPDELPDVATVLASS